MWRYDNVTREEFEKRKARVREIMCELGAEALNIELPYACKRPVFKLNDEYFRVDELLFSKKPFIVIEFGTYDELLKNIMEDAEPFPYDLSDNELKNEVSYSLGIKPYPAIYGTSDKPEEK